MILILAALLSLICTEPIQTNTSILFNNYFLLPFKGRFSKNLDNSLD